MFLKVLLKTGELETKTLLFLSTDRAWENHRNFLRQQFSKVPSNVLECWIVLDLLQRLLKPMPITVSFVGLFCSVGTCRLWNPTRLQLLSHRSPHSHQLVTTVTHYPLKMWSDWQHRYEKPLFFPLLKPRLSIPHVEKSQPFPFLRSLCCYPNPLKLPLKTCLYSIKQVETQSNLPTTKNILKSLVPQQRKKRVFTYAGQEKMGRREGREWTCHVLAGEQIQMLVE